MAQYRPQKHADFDRTGESDDAISSDLKELVPDQAAHPNDGYPQKSVLYLGIPPQPGVLLFILLQ